ncbi:MAG: hypothetical protein KDE63_12290 [Novosphingobium sp.]|nr:hypothetical protein [Novosphingobium sp.]
MIRIRRITITVFQLLFAACFLLAGTLSASASSHGGTVGPILASMSSGAAAGKTGHQGRRGDISAWEKTDCHGQDRQGKQEHTGSCCDATCFVALVLTLSHWTHVQPKDVYLSNRHLRVASMERMLLERPPKQ